MHRKRLFDASVTLDRQGAKVAFVGVTDIGASNRQPPSEFRGMDTTRMDGLRDFVKELSKKERPDVVVALTHTGLSIARQIAREIPELDVILSGHTHERTERPILEGNVIIVEPGCFGSFLGRLDLVLKPGGGVASHQWRLIPILASHYAEDPEMKKRVDTALAPHRHRMREVVGKAETLVMRYDVLETTADNFITDAVREYAKADSGFSNGFRFAPPILAGNITQADLWNLLPMDARVKIGYVTGKELREYLEGELELVYSKNPWKLNGGWGPRASGLAFTFRARAKPGQRVLSIRVSGKAVRDDEKYSIAGCEREGEPIDVICRHRGTHDPKVIGPSVHAALDEYLKRHAAIAPRRDGREVAVDLPATVFSQDAILAGGTIDRAPTTPRGIPR